MSSVWDRFDDFIRIEEGRAFGLLFYSSVCWFTCSVNLNTLLLWNLSASRHAVGKLPVQKPGQTRLAVVPFRRAGDFDSQPPHPLSHHA